MVSLSITILMDFVIFLNIICDRHEEYSFFKCITHISHRHFVTCGIDFVKLGPMFIKNHWSAQILTSYQW